MTCDKRFIFSFSLICFLLCTGAKAFSFEHPITEDSTVIGQNYGYPSGTPHSGYTKTGNLDLVFETTFFFDNLEITGLRNVDTHGRDLPLDGETFIGFRAPVRLRYRPHEQITLEAGAILGHNFGDDKKIDEVEPLFRVVYEPVKDVFLVAGTLIKTHAIHDAIYADVLEFRRPSEQGFQLRADLPALKEDLWINWRIRETAMRAEQFEVGNVTQIRSGGFRGDGQLLWAHIGGQKHVGETAVNNVSGVLGGSYGVNAGRIFSFLDAFKDVRLGGYYISSTDRHPEDPQIENVTGTGFEGRLTMDIQPSKNVNIFIFGEYFKGNGLVAKLGNPLYTVKELKEVGVSTLFKLPAGLRLEVGFTGIFVQGKFVHTEKLYISWGQGFPILKNL